MTNIAIIDYGVGNLRSVEKAFAATGHTAFVTGKAEELLAADRLVLPGVGAFAACMTALGEHGLIELVKERAVAGTPLIGVCVGMQMLFEESDEFGKSKGLGLLKGRVRKFSDDLHDLVVPQVGWNQVVQRREHPLFAGVPDNSFCYFVHSFYCEPANDNAVIGETDYGQRYASVVAEGNICGVQFHPEKSQAAGLRMLANFAMSDMISIVEPMRSVP